MNTSKHYEQQQKQQGKGYRARALSAAALSGSPTPSSPSSFAAGATATNLGIPMGRPLPRTPGLQQHLDPSMPNGTGLGIGASGLGAAGSSNNISPNGPYINPNANNIARSSRVSVNITQSSSTLSTTLANNNSSTTHISSHGESHDNNSNSNTRAGHTSWIQGLSKSSLSLQQQEQQRRRSLAEDPSYQAALTRPISPTMIMNYIPPPATTNPSKNNNANNTKANIGSDNHHNNSNTNNSGSNGNNSSGALEPLAHPMPQSSTTTATPIASSSSNTNIHNPSLRIHSATAALSPSFNTLGQSASKPVTHLGGRNYVGSNISNPNGGTINPQPPSVSAAVLNSEDPTSNSSRFARRGPLMMNYDNSSHQSIFSSYSANGSSSIDTGGSGGGGFGARSRHESAVHTDLLESPASIPNQSQPYQQSSQTQIQFSPGNQRVMIQGNGSSTTGFSPASYGTGTQLQTWKRIYAIGRYRGDAHPGVMTLFKDNEHLFPTKTIDMAECYEVQVKGQDAKATGRFEFKVVSRKEETWFATDTMSERTAWIDALNSLMVAKAVGASLMKLEAKLNNIRHRNNSLEYAHITPSSTNVASNAGGFVSSAGAGVGTVAGSMITAATNVGSSSNSSASAAFDRPSTPSSNMQTEHLSVAQQDLATREQLLAQREQELERKRTESLLVQLEAWRAAAKVTVNQHYAVRDQLLERVMKTARTVQELLERARIHLETGSDQITEIVQSHLECLRVHTSESAVNATSCKMLKSILVGLTVNLDTRSSELKRVLLVLDQYINTAKRTSSSKSSHQISTTTSTSSPTSPTLAGLPTGASKERRLSVGGTSLHSSPLPTYPPSTSGITMYLIQVRDKYRETLEVLQDYSKRLKQVLERADVVHSSPESVRKFRDEIQEALKGLTKMPSYVFTPCLPDQPLPGAADTFYREDLVLLHQQKNKAQQQQQQSNEREQEDSASLPTTDRDTTQDPNKETTAATTASRSSSSASTSSSNTHGGAPALSLALPPSLSSFLLLDTTATTTATTTTATTTTATTTTNAASSTVDAGATIAEKALVQTEAQLSTASAAELTQKLRDTILPEFEHLSIKQEESLQSMTTLLNQISSTLVNRLTEIKDATAGQRQEFEELKDEIIDVMQLSATDPSGHQRDISALSEIRSKLAEITDQLTKVQDYQNQQNNMIMLNGGGISGRGMGFGQQGYFATSHPHHGHRRLVGSGVAMTGSNNGNSATATGLSLLQRSASTMVHPSFGSAHPFYNTIDGGSSSTRPHLQRGGSSNLHNRLHQPPSVSITPKIAGMTRLFEDGEDDSNDSSNLDTSSDFNHQSSSSFNGGNARYMHGGYDSDRHRQSQELMISKLDQLLLLLEFVNTAQCRMMAYQDLEFDRQRANFSGTNINVDDNRMMAVQEYMEQMDRKMNLQMHLLRRLASIQGTAGTMDGTDDVAHSGAQVREITDDNGIDDKGRGEDDMKLNNSHGIEEMIKTLPPENELSLIEVLNRLDLQIIPSVKDQSGRIQELSDQLTEMKRQLDEQQRRLEQQHNFSGTIFKPRVPTPNVAPILNRSKSTDHSTTPLMLSRSSSQASIQQQQQHQKHQQAASLASPLDTESSPASWRASLRPSNSTGSSFTQSRERLSSSPTTGAVPSPASSLDSLPSSTSATPSSGTNEDQTNVIMTKTSDRIVELLDRMDAKMSQMIDDQLPRYEKGNNELLTKVCELLDDCVDKDSKEDDNALSEDDNQGNKGTRRRGGRSAAEVSTLAQTATVADISKADLIPLTQKLQGLETMLMEQNDHEELRQVGNKALWKEMMIMLEDIHRHHRTATPSSTSSSLDRAGNGMDGDLTPPVRTSTSTPQLTTGSATAPPVLLPASTAATETIIDSLERLKFLIQGEADRSESSLNEQRDEILEKMNQVLSSIQESQGEMGSRDAAVKEELQEMREWIVKHSSMQTENLREIVFAARSTVGSTIADATASAAAATVKDRDREDVLLEADVVNSVRATGIEGSEGRGGGGCSSSGSEEEYTRVDILDDLEQEERLLSKPTHLSRSRLQSLQPSYEPLPAPLVAVTAEATKEIQGLKEQLEMFTKVQMATFSELADNVSGVEKMMRDMSKVMGIRRGGTLIRKREAEQGRAMLAMEVKETIEEVMARMGRSNSLANISNATSSSSSPPVGSGGPQKTPRSSIDSQDEASSNSNNNNNNNNKGFLPRGDSGLFKYLYQPRRSAASNTNNAATDASKSTTLATSPSMASSLLAEVTPMSINTSSAMLEEPSSSIRSPGSPLSPIGGTESLPSLSSSSEMMQEQMDLLHDQMEQLYNRKARVEVQVQGLESEKHQLTKEKEELMKEVEMLRKEKQDLLMANSAQSATATATTATNAVSSTATEPLTMSTNALLEKALSDRVAMLLQETARLEILKKQLENQVKK
ncbi:hypothetical protein BX616_001556 [Lobosporangium transversale]|nr:hypothetical protein BX616_001556 [Lobosporangium transversale]